TWDRAGASHVGPSGGATRVRPRSAELLVQSLPLRRVLALQSQASPLAWSTSPRRVARPGGPSRPLHWLHETVDSTYNRLQSWSRQHACHLLGGSDSAVLC